MRVVIDANGYRERRAEALRAEADDAADEALSSGGPVELDPLPPFERRIVHEYLRERGDVETHSEGNEPERYLVVSPLARLRAARAFHVKHSTGDERAGRRRRQRAGAGRPGRSYGLSARTSAAELLILADEHAPTTFATAARRSTPTSPTRSWRSSWTSSGAPGIADLGSGAGFPGLAIAVALPEAEVSLVESQRRKCEFLERACAAAGVENARVVCARAEEWSEGVGRRRRGGRASAGGADGRARVRGAAAADGRRAGRLARQARPGGGGSRRCARRAMLGLRRVEIRRVAPFEGATDRHLHVFVKVGGDARALPAPAGHRPQAPARRLSDRAQAPIVRGFRR